MRTENEQADLWNGPAGRGWVEAQGVLDRMFQPFEDILLEGLPPGAGERVLDVGCGTGATTFAAARRVSAGGGSCVGVDLSEPMIAAARARAAAEDAPASFLLADAQAHAFESFDKIISRFGVMFFQDPVQAFANLRRAAREGAGLRLVAWRGAEENPFMTAAEEAAAPLLPGLPARRLDGPGQFAFADRRRMRRILEQGGWSGIEIRPLDVACAFPERDLLHYLTWLGPVGRALQEAEDGARARILEKVRAAFDPYVHGAEVRFDAACWMVSARA